ncbi:MAG: rod shape-determining protein RodA [Rickettsiaceae bacterium H1]|nr:rod shape-determining protein RodA [Rickettsiaceae bacterium H1]
MKEKLKLLDKKLILCFFSLIFIGFSIQYSAAGGNFRPWTIHQISIVLLSLPILGFTFLIKKDLIFKYTYPVFFLITALLFIVEFLGITKMGATRWINLFGIVLQPSELAKVTIILALSKYFKGISSEQKLTELILPVIISSVPITLTLLQPSLGSAIIMILITVSIFFIAEVEKKYFLWAIIICIIFLPFTWKIFLYDYQKLRILSFLHPEQDLFSTGYNLFQSKIAIGSGGMYGRGFLHGNQIQLGFLPEKHTDFVFTVFTEEQGFAKTVMLFILYTYLITKGLLIADKTMDKFGKLIAVGVSTFFAIHVIINIGMVTGLLPVVGIPLPLLSYGGSIMLTSMLCFGLLLNVDINNKLDCFQQK